MVEFILYLGHRETHKRVGAICDMTSGNISIVTEYLAVGDLCCVEAFPVIYL